MPHHALDERQDLAATLRSTAASAPTLCGDWDAAHLAAHLALRERSLSEVAGRVPSRRLHAFAGRRLDAYLDRAGYPAVVDAFAAGPPRFSPFAVPALREAVNLLEYVVHHEDVRRAGPDVTPRVLPADRQMAVWQRLRTAARLTLRMARVPVRLEWPSHGTVTVGRAADAVTVAGDPVELALVAFGRQRAAHVDYRGDEVSIQRLRTARIAL